MLILPPKIAHAEAVACLELLISNADRQDGGVMSVDASHLERFDSSALAVLLSFRRWCALQGRKMQLLNAPPHLLELAHVYGVDELLLLT